MWEGLDQLWEGLDQLWNGWEGLDQLWNGWEGLDRLWNGWKGAVGKVLAWVREYLVTLACCVYIHRWTL